MTDTTKLAFKWPEPERGTILPIKMDRDRWFAIASKNNDQRAKEYKRTWYRHEMDDRYGQLYG